MALSVNQTLRLAEDQYMRGLTPKTGIALHHTVGGSVPSTVGWWKRDGHMVGTAYLIERDGTVFEVFDPQAWAWQFGLKRPEWSTEERIGFEKRFIGIELASEGGLIEADGELYCFNTVSPRTRKDRREVFDCGKEYRGFRYFDHYEPAQVDALVELINELCDRFSIERRVPVPYLDYHGIQLRDFKGIIGHTMVRSDKTDPLPDEDFWRRITGECRLEAVDIAAPAADGLLTETQLTELFENNVQHIHRMNVAAGSMVKGLIMELDRGDRDTYIRLRDPDSDGYVVHYDLLEGDGELVYRLGRALGFKDVSSDRLEVQHA